MAPRIDLDDEESLRADVTADVSALAEEVSRSHEEAS